MKKNWLRMLSVMMCFLLCFGLMAGCGNGGGEEQGDGTEAKTELVVSMNGDVKSLDPMKNWQVASYHFYWTIYERLIYLNEETGEYEPELATSWEVSEDGTEYTFHLREGVKWHDGSDFGANDVKYTIERGIELGTGNYPSVKSVEVIDNLTVKVILENANSIFLDKQWTGDCCVIKEGTDEELAQAPMGTGPFKFVEWVSGDHITIEAFDEYWGEQSGTEKITFKIMPEANARLMALQAGDLDAAALEAAGISSATSDENLTILSTPSIRVNYLGFNHKDEIMGNELVRKAISHAIDKEAIVTAQLEGQGITIKSLVPAAKVGFYDGFEGYDYDVEKAKELLAEAGYPDGFECTLSVSAGTQDLCAQVIQANLKDVGITLTINTMEAAAFNEYMNSGQAQLFVSGRSAGQADAYVNILHSDRIAEGNNKFNYSDAELDAMIEKTWETSGEERNEIYADIQTKINDEALILPLYSNTLFLGVQKDLQDMKCDAEGCHDFRNAHF